MKCEYNYCDNDVSEESVKSYISGRSKHVFCSKLCSEKNQRLAVKIEICKASGINGCCNLVNSTTNIFCSRSCAATYNNTVGPPKRVKQHIRCKVCNTIIERRIKYCSTDCNLKAIIAGGTTNLHRGNDLSMDEYIHLVGQVKLSELWQKTTQSKHSFIRQHARNTFSLTKIISCENCGYSLFIDVCHIKPVSSFSDDTKLCVINSLENLVGLCKNCHFELDRLHKNDIESFLE